MESPKNKPEKRFKCGPVSASIWAQTKIVKGVKVTSNSISIDKAYKVGDSWKHTSQFFPEDLPKVMVVLRQAYEALMVKE